MKLGRTAVILLTLAGLAAACSSDTKKSISEAVARNAVAVGMKKEFADRDHPLDGLPTCKATAVAGSNTKVDVTCTATTRAGEDARLLGRTQGANEVRGTFTGFVNNTVVFENDTCIGC